MLPFMGALMSLCLADKAWNCRKYMGTARLTRCSGCPPSCSGLLRCCSGLLRCCSVTFSLPPQQANYEPLDLAVMSSFLLLSLDGDAQVAQFEDLGSETGPAPLRKTVICFHSGLHFKWAFERWEASSCLVTLSMKCSSLPTISVWYPRILLAFLNSRGSSLQHPFLFSTG
jgi:hypothetical protein